MAAHSQIEWCDATWQVASGCTPVSEGCRLCYSARLCGTRLKHNAKTKGLVKRAADGRLVFNGRIRVHEDALAWPMLWRGAPAALAAGRRSRIFVADRTDLFHEAMPEDTIARVFAAMALSPRHDFIVLTKRGGRMRALVSRLEPKVRAAIAAVAAEDTRLALKVAKQWEGRSPFDFGVPWPLKNVWLGVSVEDQAAADERVPDLIATPAAKRLLSCEPLLGPIDLTIDGLCYADCATCEDGSRIDPETNANDCGACDGTGKSDDVAIDWVIVGGESGTGARPMHPDWARSLRDQCAAAGVAFHLKQWGEWAPARVHTDEMFRVGKRRAGRELDGRTHDGFPS